MFCKNCGQKIDDDSVFCTSCGHKLDGSQQFVTTPLNNERESIFAKLSNIFGNISLWLCWTIFVPFMLADAGIILGILGMIFKNKFPKYSEMAKPALIKNIVALAISLVLFIITVCIIDLALINLFKITYIN